MQEINEAGLKIIKDDEGLSLVGYQDHNDKPTVGFGHTGPDVYVGMVINQLQADNYLQQDVSWARQAVESSVNVPLNTNQFSALVSLVYNIGSGHFQRSPVLASLNQRHYLEAADNFLVHCHNMAGEVLPGLHRRRMEERELFWTEVSDGSAVAS